MRILLINQCFHPDHVSTSQHLTDLALALVAAGHEVSVIASRSAYDCPEVSYPKEESWQGVGIRRAWTPGLGKRSKLRRIADALGFFMSASWLLARTPQQDVVVALTSPPLISVLAALFAKVKGGKLISWVMDLNPDEAIVAGWLRADSVAARFLAWILTWSLKSSAAVVALDEHMARRIETKRVPRARIEVEPPWTHDSALHQASEADRTRFRKQHGLEDSFVVMYSGNHSPCHPLDTLMEAAVQLSEKNPALKFVFVGGGGDYHRIKSFAADHSLTNVLFLPYQPLENLGASLGAADLHVVVMGDPFVGIVHPCKIYNILWLGLPFLFVGPPTSHIGDIVDRLGEPHFARSARHGDVDAVCLQILDAAALGALPPLPAAQRLAVGYRQAALCERWVTLVERVGAGLGNQLEQLPSVM